MRTIEKLIALARASGWRSEVGGENEDGFLIEHSTLPEKDMPAWLAAELRERSSEVSKWLWYEYECKRVEREVCEVFDGAKVIGRRIRAGGVVL